MTSVATRRAIFTICSGNYFPYARILLTSLQKYHPESTLFLGLADRLQPAQELGIEGVEIIPAAELTITHFADFAFRYEIGEFNIAIKPFVIQELVENRGFEEVVYLDPDIELFAPMNPVFDALAAGADFVLTPHITEPAEFGEFPDDIGITKAGINNPGFLAVNNSLNVINFLYWWGRRLRFQSVKQPNDKIALDQQFLDLLPVFYRNVSILNNKNLGVAYWNLDQRELSKTEEGWLINDQPLIFFHFSGISPQEPHRLSKYTSRFRENLTPALQAIISSYIAKLKKFGFGSTANPEYGYARFNNGIAIANVMRRCYRDTQDIFLENPFDSFANYLNQSVLSPSDSPWLITNLMYYFWTKLEVLVKIFNLEHTDSRHNYALWFVQNAPNYGIDAYFINPILDNLSSSYVNQIKLNSQQLIDCKAEVGVIGYLKAELGVGHAGRMVASSFCQSQVNTQGYNVTINVIARQAQTRIDDILVEQIDAQVEIYNVNAHELMLIRQHLADKINEDAYKINMPFWELSRFPDAWVDNYQGIDEIWAPSRFVQGAIQTKLALPVLWLPPAVTIEPFTPRERSYFQLPDHSFLFHFNFDFTSYATRKNASAAIEAYRLAFPLGERSNNTSTALVIKTRGYDPEGKNWQKLRDLTEDTPDIYLLNEEMTYDDAMALMNCCDCYISLHRSEGFGYTLAEAMLLEKPVIATDYSGSRDFIDGTTGFPVSYSLVSVKEDEYPFWESQIWAEPNLEHAAWLMRRIVLEPTETKQVSRAGKHKILTDYSPARIGQLYKQRLEQIGIV